MALLKTKIEFKSLMMIAMAVSLAFPLAAMAEEGQIITILASGGDTTTGIEATPSELTIEPGIIVIWVNAIKGDEVNILFDDGKTTENATADPMGFDLDKNGAYAAKYLPFLATTSLRFIKQGTYQYKVISQNKKFVAQGTLTVP